MNTEDVRWLKVGTAHRSDKLGRAVIIAMGLRVQHAREIVFRGLRALVDRHVEGPRWPILIVLIQIRVRRRRIHRWWAPRMLVVA